MLDPFAIATEGVSSDLLSVALLGFNFTEGQPEFIYEPIIADIVSIDHGIFGDVVSLDQALSASLIAEAEISGPVGENDLVNIEGELFLQEPHIVADLRGVSSSPSSTAKKNLSSKATIINLTSVIQATVKKT